MLLQRKYLSFRMNFQTFSTMYPMPRFINPINSKLKPYYLSITSAEINMFFNKSIFLLPINKLDHISKTLNMINIEHAQTKTLYTRPGLLSSWSKLGRAELTQFQLCRRSTLRFCLQNLWCNRNTWCYLWCSKKPTIKLQQNVSISQF